MLINANMLPQQTVNVCTQQIRVRFLVSTHTMIVILMHVEA